MWRCGDRAENAGRCRRHWTDAAVGQGCPGSLVNTRSSTKQESAFPRAFRSNVALMEFAFLTSGLQNYDTINLGCFDPTKGRVVLLGQPLEKSGAKQSCSGRVLLLGLSPLGGAVPTSSY